jgi:hypothetical protein
MQLAQKRARTPYTARKGPTKGKARVRKKVALRRREGAGRPSLHPGKDMSRHATAYFTEEGWDKLADIQDELLRQNTTGLSSITVSDALAEAVNRLHRELMRPR